MTAAKSVKELQGNLLKSRAKKFLGQKRKVGDKTQGEKRLRGDSIADGTLGGNGDAGGLGGAAQNGVHAVEEPPGPGNAASSDLEDDGNEAALALVLPGGSGLLAGHPAPLPPPPPAPPGMAALPPGFMPRMHGQNVYVLIHDWGYIVGTQSGLNAHCLHHFHSGVSKCHMDKTRAPYEGIERKRAGQGRPLGLLYLWLQLSHEYELSTHSLPTTKRQLGSQEYFSQRQVVREALFQIPSARLLFTKARISLSRLVGELCMRL